MDRKIRYSVFAVGDEPHCVWARDLAERNMQFLDGIDGDYFRYIADTHQEHLANDHAQRAAIALRTNYYLSLETLFGLIGAALQAPDCAVGWVHRVRSEQLRAIVQSLSKRAMTFPIKWQPMGPLGFDKIAQLVFDATTWAHQGDGTVERFAVLWARLAADFLDPQTIAEYNGIKHGFRVRSGGFSLRVGTEHQYGVPPPEEEMGDWRGGLFGSSFYSADPIGSRSNRGPHFTLRQHSLNWLPDNTIGRMLLAAMSIKNVRSFLTIVNGRKAGEAAFDRPGNSADFDLPWERSPGITSFSLDLTVGEKDIYRASKKELLDILKPGSPPPHEC